MSQSNLDPENLAKLISEKYLYDHDLFTFWEQHGFHITPANFNSPVPNLSELEESLWEQPTKLVGIDTNEQKQMDFLKQVCLSYKDEYDAFPNDPTGIPYQYYFNQTSFRSIDAEVLYCVIRHFRPSRIIEIGGGYSTYVTAAAVRKNSEGGNEAELITIDPYPNDILRAGFPGLGRLLVKPVQQIDINLFLSLEENDILFIDSSHVAHIGSDVCYLLLEVIPRLSPGVLIHFHDIMLPLEYPRNWIFKNHYFWNEQYLLQAFLAFNRNFKVLWAGSYMRLHHLDEIEKAFASFDLHTVWPASFWIQRKPASRKEQVIKTGC